MRSTLTLVFFLAFGCIANAQTEPITATVEQRSGYYLFFPGQQPTITYEVVGSFKTPGFVKSDRHEGMINAMIGKAEKEGLKGDGILFTDENLAAAVVIRFKK